MIKGSQYSIFIVCYILYKTTALMWNIYPLAVSTRQRRDTVMIPWSDALHVMPFFRPTVCIRCISSSMALLSDKSTSFFRNVEHPNICRFIGGCVELPNISIVTEYCAKGSLNDVLMNDDIPLNWGFRWVFTTQMYTLNIIILCIYSSTRYFYHADV